MLLIRSPLTKNLVITQAVSIINSKHQKIDVAYIRTTFKAVEMGIDGNALQVYEQEAYVVVDKMD